MRLRFLCALALFIAQPAFANDEAASDECAQANSTIEMVTCLSGQYEALEIKRLALEEKIAQEAEEYDSYVEEEESRKGRSVEQGDIARKSYESYRHDECKRQAYLAGAGTIASLGKIGCLIQLTEQRIEILEQEER